MRVFSGPKSRIRQEPSVHIPLASYMINISGPGDDQEVQRLLDIGVKVVEVKDTFMAERQGAYCCKL